MERILRQRDRLLAVSARYIGLAATLAAVVPLALPDSLPTPLLIVVLPFFAALGFVQYRMGATKSLTWPILTVVVGLTAAVVVRMAAGGSFDAMLGTQGPGFTPGASNAVRVLAAGAVASASILLTISLGRMLILVGAFAVTMITVVVLFAGDRGLAFASLVTIAGWGGLVTTGWVLSAGLLRAARRTSSIGRAHRSERQASELEAQRRQSARLLHDTVLATLTLLAHSGVGVSKDALRRQAGDDARLLRQLRLSSVPLSMSNPTGQEQADGSVATDAGDTLEAVRRRFDMLGLEVSWHGASSVALPSARLDAFLLALSECLENVRRHAGTMEAHVTITDDEANVRALVTDNGEGFVPADVPAGKLGYRESIVARLSDVGGNARVFSAPGSGTTVVLEVPK